MRGLCRQECLLHKRRGPICSQDLNIRTYAVLRPQWTAKLPGGVTDRWRRIADEVGTRTEDQCIRRAAELRGRASATIGKPASGAAGATPAVAGAVPGGADKTKKAGNPMMKMPVQEFAKLVKHQQAAKVAEEAQQGKGDKDKGARAWTAEEQTLLENAMRAIDKTAEDRWGDIAERCP